MAVDYNTFVPLTPAESAYVSQVDTEVGNAFTSSLPNGKTFNIHISAPIPTPGVNVPPTARLLREILKTYQAIYDTVSFTTNQAGNGNPYYGTISFILWKNT